MKTIWKYPVPLEVEFWIDMPSDAQVLHLGMQRRNPYLWVLVEPENPLETVAFMITGTGHDVPEGDYIGTFMTSDDMFVWHLFQRSKE